MSELAAIVTAAVRRLEGERPLGRGRDATIAELAGWVALGLDPEGEAELLRLLSLHGRSEGLGGHPASTVALRLLALDEGWREAAPGSHAKVARLLRLGLAAALDAHDLGVAEARDALHHREIREMTPLFGAGSGRIVLVLLTPLLPELLDAAMARLLNARGAAHTAVIDLLGAGAEDRRLYDTLAGLLRDPAAAGLRLVLTGCRDEAVTRAGLAAAGADLGRIGFAPSLSVLLGG